MSCEWSKAHQHDANVPHYSAKFCSEIKIKGPPSTPQHVLIALVLPEVSFS